MGQAPPYTFAQRKRRVNDPPYSWWLVVGPAVADSLFAVAPDAAHYYWSDVMEKGQGVSNIQ